MPTIWWSALSMRATHQLPDAMHDRLGEFALSLHPDKTRLIEFGRFAANDRRAARAWKAGNLHVLGLHLHLRSIWLAASFSFNGRPDATRVRGKLRDIKAELRRRMHEWIPEQGNWLRQVVAGHFAYYAVPTNSRALSAFRHYVDRSLAANAPAAQPGRKAGSHRERMTKLVADWLPPPRILHPWPDERFDVRHPR